MSSIVQDQSALVQPVAQCRCGYPLTERDDGVMRCAVYGKRHDRKLSIVDAIGLELRSVA